MLTEKQPDEAIADLGEELGAPCWHDLCEKDDRTSPEEYPDHALITRSELVEYITVSLDMAMDPKATALHRQAVSAALEKARWDADAILGEFHGFLYDLIEKAEKAGDTRADALLTYVHDQFIPYRTRARGEDAKRDFAPELTFQPSN
jgi:hypothetical protein